MHADFRRHDNDGLVPAITIVVWNTSPRLSAEG
jgi:hypothetical protein